MVATAAVGIVAVTAPPAQAAPCPTKCYSAVLAPAQYTAGSTLPFSVKITNLTAPGGQLVGSIDITPPAGFTVTSVDQPVVGSATLSGNRIQLRDLRLVGGQSATYSWTAQTPAAAGAFTWLLAAKQSNDFNGTGNDVTLDPASSSTTTTGGTSGAGSCASGSVSCGTNFIDYSKDSAVSTGAAVNDSLWHVGTTRFPATTATGGQLYNMVAKEVPDALCLGQPCAFQMNIDDIPAQYVGRPATLTLLVHKSRFPADKALLVFKQIEDGSVQTLLPCALSLGQTCFQYTRDAAGDLLVTVRNLHPGDPKIAGMAIP